MFRFRQRDSVYNEGGSIERRRANGSLVSGFTQLTYRIANSKVVDEVKVTRNTKTGEFAVRKYWCSPGLTLNVPVGTLGDRLILNKYIPQAFEGTTGGIGELPYGGSSSTRLVALPQHLPNPKGITTALTRDQANVFATNVVMRSNPSKPYVSMPVFIAELRDLPRSIRDKGREDLNAARRSGNNSVAVQYGILPTISDLLKLTHFSEQVDRRIKELRRMREEGGFRKKVWILKKDHRRSRTSRTAGSMNTRVVAFGGGFREVDTFNSVWGVIRWKADGTKLPPSGSNEERKLIKATLQGMSGKGNLVSYLSDLWEILPWSWMADWFGNIGDYLQAYSSTLPAKPSQLHIMQTVRTSVTEGPFLNGQTFSSGHEQKYRFKSNPALTAHFGFLTPKQLSILAGIGLSRSSPLKSGT